MIHPARFVRRSLAAVLATGLVAAAPAPAQTEAPTDPDQFVNDYPTAARVDYVIGCMAANGQTVEMLHKCSCSIDFIASLIPYAEYERIETLMQLQQLPGAGRNAIYKNSVWANKAVTTFKEAQAESTLRCF